MARKQYVNLDPNCDPNAPEEYGPLVVLKADITEDKPGDSDPDTLFFFIDPQPGNYEKLEYIAAACRPQGFDLEEKYRYKVDAKVKDKKAYAEARIGIFGGDKYKFKKGKKDDKSDADAYADLEVEVWRKVLVRMGHMKGCSEPDMGGWTGQLDKVFVEAEAAGVGIELDHQPYVRDVEEMIDKLDKGQAVLHHPSQTAKIIFVDRIAEPSEIGSVAVYSCKELKNSRVQFFDISNAAGKMRYTWPDDKDWLVRATYKVFDEKDDERLTGDFTARVSKKTTGEGTYHKHGAEGFAATSLKLDFRDALWPEFQEWLDAGKGTMDVVIQYRVIANTAAGSTPDTVPWIMLATRDAIDYKDEADLTQAALHELGHNLGLTLKKMPKYKTDTGVPDGTEDNGYWYRDHGGTGPHCNEGAMSAADGNFKMGSCIMFHAITGISEEFCPRCEEITRRARLTTLGLKKVWGEEWKKV